MAAEQQQHLQQQQDGAHAPWDDDGGDGDVHLPSRSSAVLAPVPGPGQAANTDGYADTGTVTKSDTDTHTLGAAPPLRVGVVFADDCSACVQFENVTHAFMSALQEALCQDVPCYAVHTAHLDDVPSSVPDAAMAMRFGRVALRVPGANPRLWSAELAAARRTGDVDRLLRLSYVGRFHVRGEGALLRTLRAGDIEWAPADADVGAGAPSVPLIEPVLPTAVLAQVKPSECVSGEVRAVLGSGRNGPPWVVVPDVRWSTGVRLVWHLAPHALPRDMQATLVERAGCASILRGPSLIPATAGLKELVHHVDAPSGAGADAAEHGAAAPRNRNPPWPTVFSYLEDATVPAVLTMTTNGQMPPLTALCAALATLHADVLSIRQNIAYG